jgi:hypothetical protein
VHSSAVHSRAVHSRAVHSRAGSAMQCSIAQCMKRSAVQSNAVQRSAGVVCRSCRAGQSNQSNIGVTTDANLRLDADATRRQSYKSLPHGTSRPGKQGTCKIIKRKQCPLRSRHASLSLNHAEHEGLRNRYRRRTSHPVGITQQDASSSLSSWSPAFRSAHLVHVLSSMFGSTHAVS